MQPFILSVLDGWDAADSPLGFGRKQSSPHRQVGQGGDPGCRSASPGPVLDRGPTRLVQAAPQIELRWAVHLSTCPEEQTGLHRGASRGCVSKPVQRWFMLA